MKVIGLTLLILFQLMAGCSSSSAIGPFDNPDPKSVTINPVSIECTVAYRSSVTIPLEETKTLVISPGNQETTAKDLVFHTWYFDGSPYELRSLKTWVTTKDSDDELASVLYQLSRSEPPANQVIEHGFTGLHYVHHPVSRSEMQYWCTVKE